MSINKKIESQNNSKKKLDWNYQGKNDMHLEGKVWDVVGDGLKISLYGPWPKDIVSASYVPEKKTFEIYVKRYEGVRIAILKGTNFCVPKDTKKIQVYEYWKPKDELPGGK